MQILASSVRLTGRTAAGCKLAGHMKRLLRYLDGDSHLRRRPTDSIAEEAVDLKAHTFLRNIDRRRSSHRSLLQSSLGFASADLQDMLDRLLE